MILRLNFLHSHLDPDDNFAFQEVCFEFNKPRVGNPMDPIGVVILILAHALKWPPVVRQYRTFLRVSMASMSSASSPAAILVDAFYDAVVWAHGRPLAAMHAVLSVAGRCHALSGVAVCAGELGLVSGTQPVGGEHRVIFLGPLRKKYFPKPRAELVACVSVVEQYLVLAERARLCWPAQGASFEDFAKSVSVLMIACHSVLIDGVGLKGGKSAAREMKSKTATPRMGRQVSTRVSGKTEPGPYIVPHITRHFIIAADRLNVFDYATLCYKDIQEYFQLYLYL